MDEPTWVERMVVDAIHFDQLREHGGRPGIRDETALESALARPRNRWHYEPDSDLAGLAAAYGFGLATNRAYIDGNKRVAFLVMYVFLGMNGYDLVAPEPEIVAVMLEIASGRRDELELAAWLRERIQSAGT